MHLSKLEIFGFKSFANKTVVNFTKGITGIVGPNGCGKTNIVDAIRWCLGEQKSSMLRSDKMEDVIFNGTRLKKPMGMAEVTLTILNDKGLLPTDFTEVTITRRIFRSGESEYLLNKNLCRLKDITNLFMDTGMGTNAYSVIELKMVETILSSKAEERRKMFEEAAGVNKYKLRRRLSLKKLDDVKKDLTRVNDIVSEVEKNVRSLERQAKKADRYNTIQTELKEKELGLAEREFFLFSTQIASSEFETSNLNNQKTQIDTDIKEVENKLISFRQEISNVEAEYREKSNNISQVTNKLHELHKGISVSQERTKALTNNITRFNSNIEEFTFQKDDAKENIIEYTENIDQLSEGLSTKESDLLIKQSTLDEKKRELQDTRQVYKQKNDEFAEQQKIVAAAENEFANNEKSINTFNANIEKFNASIQFSTSEIAKSVGFLEDLGNEKKATIEKLEKSEKEHTETLNKKENLEKEISELKLQEVDEKSNLNNIKEKIEFFQTLLNNLEGVSSGSKSLMNSNGWTKNGKILLADLGSSKEEFRVAIETPLKSVLNNLIIETADDLKNGIDYLKKNKLGKASFFFLSDSKGKSSLLKSINKFSYLRKKKSIAKQEHFISWADDLIVTEQKWKNYFSQILGDVAVVDSIEVAFKLSDKFPSFSFVTTEGDLIQSNGIVEAGSELKLDDSLFGRKQLLENFKNEYPLLEQKLARLRKEIADKEAIAETINLKELSDNGKVIHNEITSIEKQISQIEYEKEKSAENIEKLQDEIQENVADVNMLNININTFRSNISEENNMVNVIKSELDSYEYRLEDIEDEYTKQQTEFSDLKLNIERIKGETQNKNNLLAKTKESITNLSNSIERLHTEIKSSEEEINTITSIIEDTQIEHDELNADKNTSAEELETIEGLLKTKKNESSEFEQQLNSYRSSRQDVSDRIHKFQIKQNELSIRFENLVNHIREEYSIELEKKEFDDLEVFNFDTASSDVSSLKGKLKNLGPINLLAYSEFEEENERLEFLLSQRNDLTESEKDLLSTIKGINDSAQKVFLETFEAIRENFKTIFQTVFNPGDEADLILEEGVDPLEAKIEIIAKPKGKRPTGIELLSGGEKTLTATALLFAIYLVKPSPFCIMDEVDAPLDDANIDRFTKLLKDFSDNTQFIIVTHNKRSMEAAENMYGVTIQEEGVSKLVGVQFNEQLSVSA
ncbi:MAG: chromosome segregation protein SMC [Melioribacteraceae bacterium]